MTDAYVVLTPILLLAVIALLGFVGCNRIYGLGDVTEAHPYPVVHVGTVMKSGPPGSSAITADPLGVQGGELLVVTVQWSSGALQQPAPTLTGADLTPVTGGGPFDWNGMKVQTFSGTNPPNNAALIVKATLVGGSLVTWNLCVSAYDSYDPDAPTYSPIQSGPIFVGAEIQASPINVGEGDLIYAVALAADSSGAFPGSNSLTPGPDFTAEFPAIANPLMEDGGAGNPVVARATNTTTQPNPRGFIFAMGIKAKPA